MGLYTKMGKPLQVSNDQVFSKSGKIVGRIKDTRVFGTDGRYVGTIIGDRLVYRATERAFMSSPFSAMNRMASASAHSMASAVMGEEPRIPD